MSILPRLDEFDSRLIKYNKRLREESRRFGAEFLDVCPNFAKTDRRLWSYKDGVHISEDRGIPLLLTLLRQTLQYGPAPETQPGQETTGGRCPEWLWRELRFHNPHPERKFR